ncbi:acyl--CoA ligase [Pseudomonas stutzeri]|nr:acyl--CoA ligase [Stutzerimonas stutzeri]
MKEQLQQWQQAWQQLIAPGAPFEVVGADSSSRHFRNAPAHLVEAVQAGRAFAERPFLHWQEQRLSYGEFYQAVDRLTAHLVRTMGVRPGQRVAIAMRNRPEWLVAFIATVQAGAVPVPLNSWGLRDEILNALEDVDASLLICDQARLALVADALPTRGVQALLVDGEGGEGVYSYAAMLGESVEPVDPHAPAPEDPALILFTSGTTQRAKAVVSSHRAVSQALYALEFQGAFAGMTSYERIRPLLESGLQPTLLLAVPLFHVSGLHAMFLNALRSGRRIVMMYKWDVDQALELVARERCTQFSGAPVMMQQLLAHPRFISEETSSLMGLGLGGGAASAGLLDQLIGLKPAALAGAGYGLTESNGIGAAYAGNQFVARPGNAGWALPIVDIRIGDDPTRSLPPGQAGPIWLRTPTLMQGYRNRPEETAETLRDGWLFTGDVGLIDEDGFLHITDRIKDLIIRGGENISAQEIEHCASSHPEVSEAAAFAMPDEQMGECVALVVCLQPQSRLDEAQLRSHMAERLAAYKLPTHLMLVREPLPRNAMGKLVKQEIKQMLQPTPEALRSLA